jgi:hypothetical protein
MKPDEDTVIALLLLTVPCAVLAHRHKYEWGAGFGRGSGLWRTSTVLAAMLLFCFVAATVVLGADEFRAWFGSKRSRGFLPFFLFPGVGLAIALFPGPASEIAGRYRELAAEKATRTFGAVGWGLFAWWLFMVLLTLLVRSYSR